jgi:DNA-binding transcriptional ArsR family regulator
MPVSRGHEVDLANLSNQTADEVADIMQALAAGSRVRILSRLTGGPSSVKELARAVEMEQPAVSQQLRVLRDLGLVVGKRQGQKTIYKLRDRHVGTLLAEAAAHAQHQRAAAAKRQRATSAEGKPAALKHHARHG